MNDLEYNPETGEVEPARTKTEVAKLAVPAHLKFSRFIDDESPNVFNIAIPLGKVAFFARELDEELLDSVTESIEDADVLRKKLQKVFDGNDQTAIAKGQKEMLAALKSQRALYGRVLEASLVGWTLEREFSVEAIKKLSTSTKAQLARHIVQASQVGVEEADFLVNAS